MQLHGLLIQSPQSRAEHGMELESLTPVGSGTGHPTLKLHKVLVAGESEVSKHAAEPLRPTDTTSLTSKAALPVTEAAVLKREKTKHTITSTSEVAPKAVPKCTVKESSKATAATGDVTPPSTEDSIPIIEATALKCQKTKHVMSTGNTASKTGLKCSKTKDVATSLTGVAPPLAGDSVPITNTSILKHQKTKHIVSTSKVTPKASSKCSKTKDATTSSTSEAVAPVVPVDATVTNLSTSNVAPTGVLSCSKTLSTVTSSETFKDEECNHIC
ncbi:hypothetical protein BDN71DRAFT_1434052 [Pleurotus eryngii]|uniref:Uncharacterized protein n=1 Tax=Pleurotus eryngii TaxID=5323 RepID=A0A9P5ZNZ9_PLEER|nr:hypothetical protein BDN71DRAFT_1434052 [Pleurotus eryngii]